jgi:hypothetical protein
MGGNVRDWFIALAALAGFTEPAAAKEAAPAAAAAEVFPKAVLFRGVAVHTRDGLALSTDVYLPSRDGASASPGRFPTVLIRLPYGKAIAQAASHWSPTFWTRHGYAYVIQDVRGTNGSEGVYEPMFHEAEDGYDTIAWIGGQPWSDGRIGTVGKSYFGGDQVLTAAIRPAGAGHRGPRCAGVEPIQKLLGLYGRCPRPAHRSALERPGGRPFRGAYGSCRQGGDIGRLGDVGAATVDHAELDAVVAVHAQAGGGHSGALPRSAAGRHARGPKDALVARLAR